MELLDFEITVLGQLTESCSSCKNHVWDLSHMGIDCDLIHYSGSTAAVTTRLKMHCRFLPSTYRTEYLPIAPTQRRRGIKLASGLGGMT